jgi:hypothetical protein
VTDPTGSFSTKSPYYDKLYRLLEDDTMTSVDIVKGLHKYYVTHISQSVELGQGSKGKKGKEGETVSDSSSNTPSKGKGKRDRDSKDKAGNGKNAKVTREKQKQGGTPRITKSDYQKLSQEQKTELADTGKVKGFKIFECKDEPGMHRCVKDNEGKTLAKVRRITRERGDQTSDEENSVESLLKHARDLFDSVYGDQY